MHEMDGKGEAVPPGGGPLTAPLAVQDEDLDMDTSMVPLSEGEAGTVEKAVRDLLGPDQQVVSVHKKEEVVQESEVIMVNGNPITLQGEEGDRIKACLLSGKLAEYPQLLNQLLAKAGLLITSPSVSSETEVTSSVTTRHCVKSVNPSTSASSSSQASSSQSTSADDETDFKEHVHEATHVSSYTDSREIPLGPRDCHEFYRNGEDDDANCGEIVGTVGGPSSPRKRPQVLSTNSPTTNTAAPLVLNPDTGDVSSGTLEELIHELVPRAHSLPTEKYQFAFLLSSRLFLTPTRLLCEVLRRTDQLSHMMSPGSHPEFVHNLLVVLQRWMVWFPTDFREESAMIPTKKLAKIAIQCHPPCESEVNHLLHTLINHLQAMDRHERQLSSLLLASPSTAKPPSDPSFTSKVDLTNFEPLTFAQELTRCELELLTFLGPEELINAVFVRDASSSAMETSEDAIFDKETIEARQRAAGKTHNLDAYVAWFNRLSYLVASSIVCSVKTLASHQAGGSLKDHKNTKTSGGKTKRRVKTIEFWIEVARDCINFANFNSLMAIITGLNMTPVRRLKKTWTKIGTSQVKFTALEHQMDPTSNFLSYRSTLRAAVTRSLGTTDKVQRVVIPFFSLLVKDLYFINEGWCKQAKAGPFKMEGSGGHLNFDQFSKLGERLREFATWKDVECPYQKSPPISEYLQKSPILSEEALDFESYECENPDMQEEKDRYKLLKQKFKCE